MPDNTVERTIAPKQLIALVKDASEKRERIASIAGDLGERVKLAVENGHLHRGAFAQMVRLHKMEEQKRNDYMRSFALYSEHCQTALWGGLHVGDIVDLAKAREDRGAEGEPQAVDDAMAASVKNAEGIRELPPEQHEANQKGKRGRAKAKAAVAAKSDGDEEAAEERGRIDHLAGKGGVVPEDITADKVLHEAYLRGWSGSQVAQSKAHDEADFEQNPPRAEALPGADAPGSYSLTH